MIEAVQTLGSQICAWDDAPWLLFSGNVFSNLIYYSHLLPAIIALLFGTLIYLSNRTKLINKVLFFIMVSFALWSVVDLILWATERVDYVMFFWSLLAYIEPLIYIGCYYLVFLFTKNRDISYKSKIGFSLLFVPVIVLTPTVHTLLGFDFTNCEREAIEGPLWQYIYVFEIFMILLTLHLGIRAIHNEKDRRIRNQNVLITTGVTLFLLTLSLGNIVGSFSFDWSIAQYGLFGMPIFIVFLSYLVIQYQRFNTKIFSTQILTGALSVLIASLLLIEDLSLIHIIVLFTFALSIIFGYFLNASIIKEYKQKKEIEKLVIDLQNTNTNLDHANEKLKGLDKLKTEFLSLATHQLRSPLTVIKGYTSMLSEGSFGKLNVKQGKIVDRVYTSAQGLVGVVEDLLNVSKIEQGGMKYEMTATNLAPIVQTLYQEMKIAAQEKGLSLEIDIPSNEQFIVRADPVKIKQVFLNLLDNSIKYTKQGYVRMSLERHDDTVVFVVTDSGIGISPETRAKLFDKFSRGEGGKMNTGGSGLGLYLAREISRAHHGNIVIESEGLGKGSTFKVLLPATADRKLS